MENTKATAGRIRARNAAITLLNRLTAGAAFTAVAGVALLGMVSAHTIPGTSSSSTQAASASASTSTSTSASASTSTSASTVSSPSTSVSSSSGKAVAVSGGSR